jgi:DNA-binding transcriptional MerR regulator
MNFLMANMNNPDVNKKVALKMTASISGFSEEEIRQLLDVNSYGSEKSMSEADRDLELLLAGEVIEPNEIANNAYKQRMVDYVRDHKEDISNKQFFAISAYIDSLEDIIFRNEARQFVNEQTQELLNLNNQLIKPNNTAAPQPAQDYGQI